MKVYDVLVVGTGASGGMAARVFTHAPHLLGKQSGGGGLPRSRDVAAAGVIKGKRIATVAKCRFDVEVCGATFVNEGWVREGNMVSGRTWHGNHLFMRIHEGAS